MVAICKNKNGVLGTFINGRWSPLKDYDDANCTKDDGGKN